MKIQTGRGKIIAAAAGVVIIVSVICFFMLSKESRAEAYRSIRIVELDGTVTIERESIGSLAAAVNMNLMSGDRVSTEEGAYIVLRLDGDKYVMLGEKGAMEVVAEGNESAGRTSIHLAAGSVLSDIRNPLGEDAAFDVVTPNATMSVRGTVFEVRRREDEGEEEISVLVYEGKVAVAPSGMESLVCKAGEYTKFTDEETPRFLIERESITQELLDEQMLRRLRQIEAEGREIHLGIAGTPEPEAVVSAIVQNHNDSGENNEQNSEEDKKLEDSMNLLPVQSMAPVLNADPAEQPLPSAESVPGAESAEEPDADSEPTEEPNLEQKPTEEPNPEPQPTEKPDLEQEPTEEPNPEPQPTEEPDLEQEPTEEPDLEPQPTEEPDLEQEPTEEPNPEPQPTEEPSPEPQPTEEPDLEPQPTEEPNPEPQPTDEPDLEPQPTEEPNPEPQPTEEPSPEPQPTEEPSPEPQPTEEPDLEPQPTEEPSPEPEPTEEPSPEPQPTEEPSPEPQPTEEPSPEPPATEEPSPEPPATEKPSPEPGPSSAPDEKEKRTVTYCLPYVALSYNKDGSTYSEIKEITAYSYGTCEVAEGEKLVRDWPPDILSTPLGSEPGKDDFTCVGWCTEEDGEWDFEKDAVRQDMTLYPIWVDGEGRKYYPVIYEAPETGFCICNSVMIGSEGYESSGNMGFSEPVREGYVLAGWKNISQSGSLLTRFQAVWEKQGEE